MEAQSTVAPCDKDGWKRMEATEKKSLAEDGRTAFTECEQLRLSLLPHVRIYRFHTPFHIDYSLMTSMIEMEGEPAQYFHGGEGMVQKPDVQRPESIRIFNTVLRASGIHSVDVLVELSNLYLYLLAAEKRKGFFQLRNILPSKPFADFCYPGSVMKGDSKATVELDGGRLQFVYAKHGEDFLLESVVAH